MNGKPMTVKSLLSEASQQIHFSDEKYELTGDILKMHVGEKFRFYTMHDARGDHEVLALKVCKDMKCEDDKGNDIFLNRRVRVTGKLDVCKSTASTRLQVERIDVLGDSLFYQEQEEALAAKLKPVIDAYHIDFQNPEVQNEYLSLAPEFKCVGLIYGKNSRAYDDFIASLGSPKPVQLRKIDVAIKKINEIVDAIKRFNADDECDCICIIRGGGSQKELALYSNPMLLEAMRDSRLPIITGIGHAKDEPLCQKFARYPAITPTAAGYFFRRVAEHYEETRRMEQFVPKLPNIKKLDPTVYEEKFHQMERIPHKTLKQEREMAALRDVVISIRKSR